MLIMPALLKKVGLTEPSRVKGRNDLADAWRFPSVPKDEQCVREGLRSLPRLRCLLLPTVLRWLFIARVHIL